jgi:hypothetical protein
LASSNQVFGSGSGRVVSDVEKRIIAAIKIYDEGFNRSMIGERKPFGVFMDTLRFYSSSLLLWICVQELQRQVDHLSHAHLIAEWTHTMIVKYFVYENIPREKWSDIAGLMIEWQKFQNRSNPRVYKELRESFKAVPDWDIPYRDKLQKIWNIDPNDVGKVWQEVWS